MLVVVWKLVYEIKQSFNFRINYINYITIYPFKYEIAIQNNY